MNHLGRAHFGTYVTITWPVHIASSSIKYLLIMHDKPFVLHGLSYFSNSVECVYVLMLQPECSLVQCREQIMEEEVAITMFETDKYASAVKQGNVVDQCFFVTYYVYSLIVSYATAVVILV